MFQIPVFRVHYKALERFIAEVYRSQEVDFLLAAGAVPGMVPEFNLTGKVPEGREWDKRVDWIKSGGRVTKYASLVLELLAAAKLIPLGRYIVDTRPAPDPIEIYKRVLLQEHSPTSERCVSLKQKFAKEPGFVKQAALVDTIFMERTSA